MEQIETEGQDPAEQPQESEEEDDEEMARSDDWGGSEKDPFSGRKSHKDIFYLFYRQPRGMLNLKCVNFL